MCLLSEIKSSLWGKSSNFRHDVSFQGVNRFCPSLLLRVRTLRVGGNKSESGHVILFRGSPSCRP